MAAVYFTYNPEDTSYYYPRCPFFSLTGWKCPGCGLQRAIHSILHLDFLQAMRHNLLFVVAMPVVLLYFVVGWQKERCQRLYRILNSTIAISVLIAIVLAWWVLRNVFSF